MVPQAAWCRHRRTGGCGSIAAALVVLAAGSVTEASHDAGTFGTFVVVLGKRPLNLIERSRPLFGHRRHETIAAAGDVLDTTALHTIGIEYAPQSGELNGQVVLLDGDIGPDRIHDFPSGNDLAAALHQQAENLEGA